MRWLSRRSLGPEGTVATRAGLRVPAAARLVSSRELRALMKEAERRGFGWDASNLRLGDNDVHFLLPYSYEENVMPIWKCRVIAVNDGFAVNPGVGKTIRYGRLDMPLTSFRRLPTASRKEEQQLLHWLGFRVAEAAWGNARVMGR